MQSVVVRTDSTNITSEHFGRVGVTRDTDQLVIFVDDVQDPSVDRTSKRLEADFLANLIQSLHCKFVRIPRRK